MSRDEERRKYLRVEDVRAVTFRVLDPKVGFRAEQVAEQQDISAGGIRLFCQESLSDASWLEFELTLEKIGKVKVLGRVAWMHSFKKGADDWFVYGIQFEEIADGDRKKIMQYVFKKQRQTKLEG